MTQPTRQSRPAASAPASTEERKSDERKSDSTPVGTLRLSGVVKTRNGFAVATIEISVAEWDAIKRKRIGCSQAFKEYIALEHKRVVMALGQKA